MPSERRPLARPPAQAHATEPLVFSEVHAAAKVERTVRAYGGCLVVDTDGRLKLICYDHFPAALLGKIEKY